VDNSWKAGALPKEQPAKMHGPSPAKPISRALARADVRPIPRVDPRFIAYFNEIAPVRSNDVVRLPNQTFDHVYPAASGPMAFLTSDQCMSCHAGLGSPYGAMFINPTNLVAGGTNDIPYLGNGVNISPYGE